MFDFFDNDDMTPIEKYFDELWFYEKTNIIQSAYSGELLEEYPNTPFTAQQIIEYAEKDDYNLWSNLGAGTGKAEKSIDDTATSIKDTVTSGFNTVTMIIKIVVGLGAIFIASKIYRNFKGK